MHALVRVNMKLSLPAQEPCRVCASAFGWTGERRRRAGKMSEHAEGGKGQEKLHRDFSSGGRNTPIAKRSSKEGREAEAGALVTAKTTT